MTIAVLGAGMIGRAIALDLAKEHDVTCFDLSKTNLQELNNLSDAVKTAAADFLEYDEYENWLDAFDIVVTAVPGYNNIKSV